MAPWHNCSIGLRPVWSLLPFLLAVGGPASRVYADANAAALQLHESLGVAIFVLVIVRLPWRLFDRRPPEPPMPGWMRIASRVSHAVLYALLFAVPATAMLGAWFGAHPVTVYVLGTVGPIFQYWEFGASLADIHGTLGDALMWLAGFHAAAGIYHHVVSRDSILVSMLPLGIGSRGAPRVTEKGR